MMTELIDMGQDARELSMKMHGLLLGQSETGELCHMVDVNFGRRHGNGLSIAMPRGRKEGCPRSIAISPAPAFSHGTTREWITPWPEKMMATSTAWMTTEATYPER
jgi:hypothetical protein